MGVGCSVSVLSWVRSRLAVVERWLHDAVSTVGGF